VKRRLEDLEMGKNAKWQMNDELKTSAENSGKIPQLEVGCQMMWKIWAMFGGIRSTSALLFSQVSEQKCQFGGE
jgi:hypothetical protein